MYNIGDMIIYNSSGVCKIVDICIPDFTDKREKYYVIQPIGDMGMIYSKIDNCKAFIRPVISREEALECLERLPEIKGIYGHNDKERDKEYKEIMASCNSIKCLGMFKGIIKIKQEKIKEGKNLNMSDEKNLQKVEKFLVDEFSTALNTSADEVSKRIHEICE